MVEGIDRFIERFGEHGKAFVIIGGTACAAILEDTGLAFRTTKDIDIMLIAEAVDASFMKSFWDFIEEGQYLVRKSNAGKKLLYRFEKPQMDSFPPCLELFSRIPLEGNYAHGHRLRIQAEGTSRYLSALLMDDDYYHFAGEDVHLIGNLPIADAIHLIPLKAKAWLDLYSRRISGESVDSHDIEKHRKDILRLYAVIAPGTKINLPEKIKADFALFLVEGFRDWMPDMKRLGLGRLSLSDVGNGLRSIYLTDGE